MIRSLIWILRTEIYRDVLMRSLALIFRNEINGEVLYKTANRTSLSDRAFHLHMTWQKPLLACEGLTLFQQLVVQERSLKERV